MQRAAVINTRNGAIALVLTCLLGQAASGAACGDWTVTPNPIFEGVEFRPSLIAAFAPDSAVAIGGPPGAGGVVRTTWDGSTWTAGMPEPLDLPTAYSVRAVAGSGPDDLWVTGLYTVNQWNGWPFLAHFDGQRWDTFEGSLHDIPEPNAGDPLRSGEGSSIVVIAPDDIWVVGNGESPDGWSSSPIAMHWDGSNFEEYFPQIEPVFSSLNNTRAIAAAARDAVWIVGSGRYLGGGAPDSHVHLFIYRFDGSSWIPQTNWTRLPGTESFSELLYDVVAFAHDDAWAFGYKSIILPGGSGASVSLYLHWDGTSWTEVEGPDIGPITSAAASGPDDIWASNAYGEYGGRLAHWDGATWSEVNSAPIPGATHIGLTNLSASPSGNVWAVGYWAIYDGAGGWEVYEDILEHFTPGCRADLNGDGNVDAGDFAALASCATGPGVAVAAGCDLADLDGDQDCDVADFAILQASFALSALFDWLRRRVS